MAGAAEQIVPMQARRSAGLQGRVAVPGDKSISHRALIFGALAIGSTRIEGLLEGEDVLNTARALQSLGVKIDKDGDAWVVKGVGIGGLSEPASALDFGNSGTGVRLMMGVLAGNRLRAVCTGDASLSRRPMGRVLNPLRQMGVATDPVDADRLPLAVLGTPDLIPQVYKTPVPSAQVKSAVLLAGLHCMGETTVIEAERTRDHTERMLAHFGAHVTAVDEEDGSRRVTLRGRPTLRGQSITVPGDPSSAAFLICAGLITPGSDVTVTGVLINATRIGLFKTLEEMGADLVFENTHESGGEPVADIRVRSSPLKGVVVPPSRAPSMIDEYPVLAVTAAFAEGETRMLGLAELKVKESDRLAATAAGLKANGVNAEVDGDTLTVNGTGHVTGGGAVETHLDHRIAMAFLTLGLGSEHPVTIDDGRMIRTSFPTYIDVMTALGADMGDAAFRKEGGDRR